MESVRYEPGITSLKSPEGFDLVNPARVVRGEPDYQHREPRSGLNNH